MSVPMPPVDPRMVERLSALLRECPAVYPDVDHYGVEVPGSYERTAEWLIGRGVTLGGREPTEAGIEAAQRAMVRWDAEDTRAWLIRRWKLSPEQAQAEVGNAMNEMRGRTGWREMAEIGIRAYLAVDSPAGKEPGG